MVVSTAVSKSFGTALAGKVAVDVHDEQQALAWSMTSLGC